MWQGVVLYGHTPLLSLFLKMKASQGVCYLEHQLFVTFEISVYEMIVLSSFSHCVGISLFVQAISSSSTTRKNKRKKKKVCVTVLVYIGVGVDRGLYCGVCVRGGCVTEDVWMSEYVECSSLCVCV